MRAWVGLVIAAAACEGPAAKPGPEVACPSDPERAESLGCSVFRALAAENEAAYVSLVMAAREDVEAMAGLRSHGPKLPSREEEVARREAAADEFHAMIEELEVRGMEPVALQLDGIEAPRAVRRGEVGFAEEILVRVHAGKVALTITIDDCVFVRGRWLVADGLKLR
jgi:hypothetical protein